MGKQRATDDDLFIERFADACSAALGLHDRFGFCHAAACLDGEGRVLDLTVFTDPAVHTVETSLEWAFCTAPDYPGFTRLVAFSTGGDPVTESSEADLALLRVMRRAFESEGVDVVDWIRCDGENVRSMAFTERSDAWGHEPQDEDAG